MTLIPPNNDFKTPPCFTPNNDFETPPCFPLGGPPESEPPKALRHNAGKSPMGYIFEFPSVLEVIGRVMEFGAAKYEDGNWRKGGKADKEYWDCLTRHLVKIKQGEVYDKDSGCAHLGHAIWNLLALMELNHPDEIFDEELFRKQCEYWRKKRESKTGDNIPT